jgi:predicted ATPase
MSTKRFILTGAPGAGKTVILRQLELDGFGVVEEAATDLIALWQARGVDKPWMDCAFLDAVTELQKQRQVRAALAPDAIQFHDRSAVCTEALARFLGYPVSAALARELKHIHAGAIYEKQVFFVRSLGFIEPTAARQISFEEALRFERVHEEVYCERGFEIVWVEPGSPEDRSAAIKKVLQTRYARSV